MRDYIHVADAVEAHVAAMGALMSGRHAAVNAEVINVGAGRGHSVLEVVEVVREMTGMHVGTCVRARRRGDAAHAVADISKAERLLEWRPKLSLRDAVAEAWEARKKAQMGYIAESVARGPQ